MKRPQFFLTLLSIATLTLASFTPANRPATGDDRTRSDDRDVPYQTKTFSGNISAVRAETSAAT